MNKPFRRRTGFSLIELLVVVLILGVVVLVALPPYLSASIVARQDTADGDARSIATAIQSTGMKTAAYPAAALADAGVLADIGGTIPNNPCSASTGAAGYTYTYTSSTSATLAAKSDKCASYAPRTFVLKM